MKLKIINIDLEHNSEYELPGVKQIVAVDFFVADTTSANLATGGVVHRDKPPSVIDLPYGISI